MAVRVEYHQQAVRQLGSIARGDKASARAIADAIDNLANEPQPHGCETLDESLYRIRVRDYRVIYGLNKREKRVVVLKIARRSEATYQGMKKLAGRFKRMRAKSEDK